MTARARPWLAVVAGVVGVALVLGGVVVGRLTAPGPAPSPGNTSAEAGFSRDMQTHHNQAVELSMIIYATTDDDSIRSLSYDIATSQATQSGQMAGWLATWNLPATASEPSMTWMTRPVPDGAEHDHATSAFHTPGERMPGLATRDQIEQLQRATGADADELFLQLMIAHHRGGVEMAEAVLARSDEPVVDTLASSIVRAQSSEIGYMEGLLGDG